MPQTAFRHTPKTGLRALPPRTPTRADLHQEGNGQEQETHEKKILPESVSILPESTKSLTKKSVPNAMSLTQECVSNVESSTVSNVQLFRRPAGLRSNVAPLGIGSCRSCESRDRRFGSASGFGSGRSNPRYVFQAITFPTCSPSMSCLPTSSRFALRAFKGSVHLKPIGVRDEGNLTGRRALQ